MATSIFKAHRPLPLDVQARLEADMVRVYRMADSTDVDDRTLAIVGTAFLEEMMEHVITTRLPVFDADIRESLFNPAKNAPLSAFVARVSMCRALNAVGKKPYEELKSIASIRNEFAHKVAVDKFSHDRVKKYLNKLKYNNPSGARWPMEGDAAARDRYSYSLKQLANGMYNVGVTDAGFGAARLE